MSRIRTTKPEFWASEQILNLTIPARLLFIGLWNFCDDSGIHPASARTLKAEVFPCDDIDINPLIGELRLHSLIVEYEVGGKSFWRVTGWKHQKIDKPTFKHPWPCGEVPKNKEAFECFIAEYSTNTRRLIDDHSPPEGIGDYRKGAERNRKGGELEGSGEERGGKPTQQDDLARI